MNARLAACAQKLLLLNDDAVIMRIMSLVCGTNEVAKTIMRRCALEITLCGFESHFNIFGTVVPNKSIRPSAYNFRDTMLHYSIKFLC